MLPPGRSESTDWRSDARRVTTVPKRPSCPLCGSADSDLHLAARDPDGTFAQPFHLLRCRGTCGVIYLADAPPVERAELLYPSSYYGAHHGRRLFRVLDRLLKFERVRLLRRFRRPGRLLDVGCGEGSFLAVMAAAGWDCTGIEASGAGAALARSRHQRLVIHEGQLGEASLVPHSFDVVTLWHVLEHVSEPRRVLRAAADLLKGDGMLVVAVPNSASWQAKVCGSHWFHLDVPRHRWHFTPASLAHLLATAGFLVVRTRHFSLEYNPYGWWQGILNRMGCETNFAYKAAKRGAAARRERVSRYLYTYFCTIGLFPVLVPAALLLAALEAALGRGGTITVVAAPVHRGQSA